MVPPDLAQGKNQCTDTSKLVSKPLPRIKGRGQRVVHTWLNPCYPTQPSGPRQSRVYTGPIGAQVRVTGSMTGILEGGQVHMQLAGTKHSQELCSIQICLSYPSPSSPTSSSLLACSGPLSFGLAALLVCSVYHNNNPQPERLANGRNARLTSLGCEASQLRNQRMGYQALEYNHKGLSSHTQNPASYYPGICWKQGKIPGACWPV